MRTGRGEAAAGRWKAGVVLAGSGSSTSGIGDGASETARQLGSVRVSLSVSGKRLGRPSAETCHVGGTRFAGRGLVGHRGSPGVGAAIAACTSLVDTRIVVHWIDEGSAGISGGALGSLWRKGTRKEAYGALWPTSCRGQRRFWLGCTPRASVAGQGRSGRRPGCAWVGQGPTSAQRGAGAGACTAACGTGGPGPGGAGQPRRRWRVSRAGEGWKNPPPT